MQQKIGCINNAYIILKQGFISWQNWSGTSFRGCFLIMSNWINIDPLVQYILILQSLNQAPMPRRWSMCASLMRQIMDHVYITMMKSSLSVYTRHVADTVRPLHDMVRACYLFEGRRALTHCYRVNALDVPYMTWVCFTKILSWTYL